MASDELEQLGGDLRSSREGTFAPPYVEDRLKRGRARMQEGAPLREQAISFWSGNQYVAVNGDNTLIGQATTTNTDGSGKPRHRVRRTFNLLAPVVAHKVSTSTARVPSYRIDPGNPADAADVDAAGISRQVALYGYEQWNIRRVTKDVVTYALVSDEGFALPYFDTSIGPYYPDGTGEGDIRIRTYSANEVYWEPGIPFDDSRWFCIEQASPVYEVMAEPGFIGDSLRADAQRSTAMRSSEREASNTKLVLVTEYYERPSRKTPGGRWLTMANKRVIMPPEEYPCTDHEGKTLDEPVLHKLAFMTDPHSDRDLGLVQVPGRSPADLQLGQQQAAGMDVHRAEPAGGGQERQAGAEAERRAGDAVRVLGLGRSGLARRSARSPRSWPRSSRTSGTSSSSSPPTRTSPRGWRRRAASRRWWNETKACGPPSTPTWPSSTAG